MNRFSAVIRLRVDWFIPALSRSRRGEHCLPGYGAAARPRASGQGGVQRFLCSFSKTERAFP